MKPFVCTGFWCLPGQNELVAGSLHVSRSGELRLSLIGSLRGEKGGAPGTAPSTILGSVDESPCGNSVTLYGCVLSGSSVGSYRGAREEYRASRGFFGSHLATDEEFRFRSVLVKLEGLSEWAHSLSGLRGGHNPFPTSRNADEIVPVLSYHVPTPLDGRLSRATVKLSFGVSAKSDGQSFRFREQPNLLVDFDSALPEGEINSRYLYPLQNLMTFVADRPEKVESVSVWRGENRNDWENNPEIRVIGPRVQPDDEKRKAVHSQEMLFTLADVEFTTFLEKWLRLAERYVEAFNIYFGIQYGPPSYLDMTYALVAQSISLYYMKTSEGINQLTEDERQLKSIIPALNKRDVEWLIDHLGARPHPAFRNVLRRLVDRHGAVLDPILANRRDAFVNQAAATLHYIRHRESIERGAASHGAELYWLMQKLRFLIKACILSELGFSTEQIAGFFNRNAYFQHISGLEKGRVQNEAHGKTVDLSLQFVVPTDAVLQAARKMAASTSLDEQQVGNALLELTDVTNKTKDAVGDVDNKKQYDLAPYFDFKFGDALEAARRLKLSQVENVRHVAETLLSQSEAIAASKESFLKATTQH